MMIAVSNALLQRSKLLTAVSRSTKVQTTDENIFGITGIDANLAVVHRTIILGAVVRVEAGGDYVPGLAFVIRTPDSGFFRIGRSWCRRRDRTRGRCRGRRR